MSLGKMKVSKIKRNRTKSNLTKNKMSKKLHRVVQFFVILYYFYGVFYNIILPNFVTLFCKDNEEDDACKEQNKAKDKQYQPNIRWSFVFDCGKVL